MKTGQQWFEEFPEPIRTMALEKIKIKDVERVSDRIALICDLDWGETDQGVDFWLAIYRLLMGGLDWIFIIDFLNHKFPEAMSKYKEVTQ